MKQGRRIILKKRAGQVVKIVPKTNSNAEPNQGAQLSQTPPLEPNWVPSRGHMDMLLRRFNSDLPDERQVSISIMKDLLEKAVAYERLGDQEMADRIYRSVGRALAGYGATDA